MSASVKVVLDSGALIAAESRARAIWSFHKAAEPGVRDLVLIPPVITQVWRDGGRHAMLARFLRGCVVERPDPDIAKEAGMLLGRAGTADAVDALVVATAIAINARAIITTDMDDLTRLCDVAGVRVPPRLERI